MLFWVDDQDRTAAGQEKLFYSTIDEKSYREYFEPFRSGQYRYVLQKVAAVAPGRALLDVGASYGWMVTVARDLGFASFGLEPGDAPCNESIRDRMVRATLDEYWRTGDTRFDVITIWHVLEHLRDPATAVQQMKDLLNDSGRLVIAVPTSDGKLFRLAMLLKRYCGTPYLLNELFYFHNPNMHFWYPSARALRILLEQSGFEVQSSETMEAFDWTTIWRRVQSPLFRLLLRLAGPFLKWSRFTASENLIMTGRKRP